MTRFRVTVRGTDVELRGYIDGTATLRLASQQLEGIGLVIASPAEDDYNPFQITEPEYPPTPETSLEIMQSIWEQSESPEQFVMHVANIHFMQANVIRGERWRAETAEREYMNRELHHFEAEQELDRLKASQDQYTRDMVARVNDAEGEADRLRADVSGASAIADALDDNWEQGDLAGAVHQAIEYLRALGDEDKAGTNGH